MDAPTKKRLGAANPLLAGSAVRVAAIEAVRKLDPRRMVRAERRRGGPQPEPLARDSTSSTSIPPPARST